jgi:hypothetical protein
MNLPIQCKPIQRTTAGQPWADRTGNATDSASSEDGGRGVQPSGYGVDASGINWGNILQQLPGLISSFF